MAVTNVQIRFGLFDVTAKDDAQYIVSDMQPFSNYENLKRDGFEIPRLASMEPLQSLLDGSYGNFPAIDTGLWSSTMSNHLGQFGYFVDDSGVMWDTLDDADRIWDEADELEWEWDDLGEHYETWDELEGLEGSWNTFDVVNHNWDNRSEYYKGNIPSPTPKIIIRFAEDHSAAGLTIHFAENYGEWTNSMQIRWYNSNDEVVGAGNFEPDSALFFAERRVINFRRIEISVLGTNKPYRYLKISGIEFGVLQTLTDSDIISAKIHEEVSTISNQIYINTLDCQLYSGKESFSILNPSGVFSLLQERQTFVVTEFIDNNTIPMGTYFLDEIDNSSATVVRLQAVDLMGIIDKTDFFGGVYDGIKVGDIVSHIMKSANAQYELHESLESIELSGYIPICTHREALQQVAFAIGAIATSAHSDRIHIFPSPQEPISGITVSQKFYRKPLELRELVTGVMVTSYKYSRGVAERELLNDTLAPGMYTITFSEPVDERLTLNGGRIVRSNANMAIIEVDDPAQVTLAGYPFVVQTQTVSVDTPNLPSSTAPNVVKVENCTLIDPNISKEVANRVYNYYQKRHQSEFGIITANEIVSDMTIIDNRDGGRIRSNIEMMDYDLTGGFRSNMRAVGVLMESPIGKYFAGSELYTGEDVGIL